MPLTKVTSGVRTLGTGEVTASGIESSLDLSSKTVTLPAASVTAHVTQFDDNQLKEDIALLAFKQASGDSAVKYDLVDQSVDVFSDASGIDASASTNETRNASGKYYSGGTALTQITNATGIGNMTTNAGIGAAFNGTRVESSFSDAARLDPCAGAFIGQDWGSGNTKIVSKFMMWAPTGYRFAGSTANKYYKLQGSTDNFSSSVVDLYTDANTSISTGATYDVTSGITVTTAYRYHRILFEGDNNGGAVGELEFYEGGLIQDQTLVSNATTAEAQPTKADLVMTYTNGAGTATIGTDLIAYASRDNGTTWTSFGLSASSDQGDTGGHTILTAHDLDISGQPAGTSMRYKITTHNQSASKETRIHAVSLGWS